MSENNDLERHVTFCASFSLPKEKLSRQILIELIVSEGYLNPFSSVFSVVKPTVRSGRSALLLPKKFPLSAKSGLRYTD